MSTATLAHALPLLEQFVAERRVRDTLDYWDDAASDLYNMLEDQLVTLLGEKNDDWGFHVIKDPAKQEAVDNILAWLTEATVRVGNVIEEALGRS